MRHWQPAQRQELLARNQVVLFAPGFSGLNRRELLQDRVGLLAMQLSRRAARRRVESWRRSRRWRHGAVEPSFGREDAGRPRPVRSGALSSIRCPDQGAGRLHLARDDRDLGRPAHSRVGDLRQWARRSARRSISGSPDAAGGDDSTVSAATADASRSISRRPDLSSARLEPTTPSAGAPVKSTATRELRA